MERTGTQSQPVRIQQALQDAAPLDSSAEHCRNAAFSKLSQTQPELQNLSGACSLQTLLAAMTFTPGGLHVRQPSLKCIREGFALCNQQQ